jgi:phosphoribosylformimino-5-aminoimidazole carboxamide ribonucleotide (ProFAR) isomerase
VKIAAAFASAGARWLHIVDLDGARTGHAANRELLLEVVRRAPCPVQAGGGVRTLNDVEEILAAGANRVVMSARALDDPDEMNAALERFGERTGVSLDSQGGTESARTVGDGTPLLDAVRTFDDAGTSFFIYVDTHKDGSLTGPDVDGLLSVTSATSLPVVYSGGIGTLEDLRTVARLREQGVSGAVVGRAFYESKFDVRDAMLAADAAAGEEEPLVET